MLRIDRLINWTLLLMFLIKTPVCFWYLHPCINALSSSVAAPSAFPQVRFCGYPDAPRFYSTMFSVWFWPVRHRRRRRVAGVFRSDGHERFLWAVVLFRAVLRFSVRICTRKNIIKPILAPDAQATTRVAASAAYSR